MSTNILIKRISSKKANYFREGKMLHLRCIIGRYFINLMIRRMLIIRNTCIKDTKYVCIQFRVKVE